MARTTRLLVGFCAAPVLPGALLYLYNLVWKGFGDAAAFGPVLFILFGYAATLTLGVPVYLILHRNGICSFPAYGLCGALIGPVFFFLFQVLTAYPGTLAATLQHSWRAALFASAYSSLAAIAFWYIAYWPGTGKSVAPRKLID